MSRRLNGMGMQGVATANAVSGSDADARQQLVLEHLGLAEALARRFRGRDESMDDLRQVAALALTKAVERYDPERGIPFVAFAVPTILGELRRHFRDAGWSVRVPRRLQELVLAVRQATVDLTQELGCVPSVSAIAARVGASADEVLEAMDASRGYRTASLDAKSVDASGAPCVPLHEEVVERDDSLAEADARSVVRDLISSLPERERTIVFLRFYEDMTQSEIADRVGISQMHVSRLLTRSLRQMRQQAEGTADAIPVENDGGGAPGDAPTISGPTTAHVLPDAASPVARTPDVSDPLPPEDAESTTRLRNSRSPQVRALREPVHASRGSGRLAKAARKPRSKPAVRSASPA